MVNILNAEGLKLAGQRIQGVGDGVAPADAVTKAQLDAAIRGLDWKNSVKVATTGAVALTGTPTIDGVATTAGDRVLVKDNATQSENGIWVTAAGAWTRAADFDDSLEVTAAAAIPVEQGAANGDAVFILTTDGVITVGTTGLAFTRLGGSGVSYTAAAAGGLVLSGSAFAIRLDASSGLALSANGVKLDPTQFAALGIARKFSVNVPAGSTTPTVTHNYGTKDVQVTVIEVATGQVVFVDSTATDVNTVTLGFAVAPGAGAYRATITG